MEAIETFATSIEEYVKKAREGDAEAIQYLYELTSNRAYFVAKKFIREEQDALDIVQDSYINAFNKLDQLEDDNKFIPWLHRIVANKARDYLKKKKPMLFTEITKEDQNVEDFVFDNRMEFDPKENYNYEELKIEMSKIIDQLSDENRMCILMFYFQQLSIAEIASVFDVSENTIKSRLNYGRKKIKEEVESLEKKGVKFYNVAPIPFMLWVLNSNCKEMIIPSYISQQVLSVILGSSGVTSVLSAGGASAASVVGYTMATSTIIKIVAGVALTVTAVTGGLSMVGNHSKELPSAPKAETNKEVQPKSPFQETQGFYDRWQKQPYLVLDERPIGLYEKGFLITSSKISSVLDPYGNEVVTLGSKYSICEGIDTYAKVIPSKSIDEKPTIEYVSSLLKVSGYNQGTCISTEEVQKPVATYDSASRKVLTYTFNGVDEQGQQIMEWLPYKIQNEETEIIKVDIKMNSDGSFSKGHGYVVFQGEDVISHNIYDEVSVRPIGEKTNRVISLAALNKDGKWKLIDKDGVNLTKPIYDKIEILNDQYAVFHQGSEVGLLNQKGSVIFRGNYEDVSAPVQNVVMVKKYGMWGFMAL